MWCGIFGEMGWGLVDVWVVCVWNAVKPATALVNAFLPMGIIYDN